MKIMPIICVHTSVCCVCSGGRMNKNLYEISPQIIVVSLVSYIEVDDDD